MSFEWVDYAAAVRRLHVGKHRDPYNRALDKAKSHGTPYTPRHAYGTPPGGDAA